MQVGPVILGTVSSSKVAEALFDLYLGEQPVSKSAKEAAAQTLQRIAAAPSSAAADAVSAQVQEEGSGSSAKQQQQQLAGYYLPSTKGHEIQCEGGRGAAMKKGKKKGGGGGGGNVAAAAAVVAGLEVEDLHACVLHMG